MFYNRRKYRDSTPQDAANSAVNKIVTLGLLVFIVYAMYTTDGWKEKPATSTEPLDYTPVEFSDYVRVKNISSGQTSYIEIDPEDENRFTLFLSREDLEKLRASKNVDAQAYEITVNTSKTCKLFAPKPVSE